MGNLTLMLKCIVQNVQFVSLNAKMSIIWDFTWVSVVQEEELRAKKRRICSLNILINKVF
jgi:hypothetical protein